MDEIYDEINAEYDGTSDDTTPQATTAAGKERDTAETHGPDPEGQEDDRMDAVCARSRIGTSPSAP